MKPLLFSLLPRPAHPTRDGSAIRNFHLLRALAGQFRVRVFVLRPPHLESQPADYPAGIGVVEVPQLSRRSRRAFAVARSLAAGGTYPELLYRSRPLERWVEEAAARERPAWIVAHSYHLGATAGGCGVASWIDFPNVDSRIWARMGRTASSTFARAFARLQAPRVERLERRLLTEARGTSCVSARDASALLALGAAPEPLLVPNGVDLSRYAFRLAPPPERLLFFVGDLSWPPNADGLRWFHALVWPLVRTRHADARVEVLGRGAPADLLAVEDESFRFLGEGDDTRPHWRRAAVAFVPLLAGGGTRLKILEAAACGVPVVSTPVGAEGLELTPGSEIAVAEEPEAFAREVSRLLEDREGSRRQAAAARKRVEARYDWGPIGEAFAAELRRRSGA